jgi:hypothetical protein
MVADGDAELHRVFSPDAGDRVQRDQQWQLLCGRCIFLGQWRFSVKVLDG